MQATDEGVVEFRERILDRASKQPLALAIEQLAGAGIGIEDAACFVMDGDRVGHGVDHRAVTVGDCRGDPAQVAVGSDRLAHEQAQDRIGVGARGELGELCPDVRIGCPGVGRMGCRPGKFHFLDHA